MDFIIWLIVAVFWVFANMANQKKQRQKKLDQQRRAGSGQQPSAPQQRQRPTPREQAEETILPSPEEQLREFLKRLGAPVEVEEPPPVQPQRVEPPQPKPEPVRQERPRPVRSRSMSDIGTKDQELRDRRARQRLESRLARQAKTLRREAVKKSIADVHAVATPRNAMIGIKGLNIPLLNVPLATPHTTHNASVEITLKNRRDLKKAVAYSAIIGKPKCMGDRPEIT